MKKILLSMLSIFLLVVLVACSTNTYTVKFDTNGGNPETLEKQVLEEDSLVTKPEGVTKAGFELQFWSVLETEVEWDFETDKVNKDMTLVANWKESQNDENGNENGNENETDETYTVSFDTNGAEEISDQSVKEGLKVVKPNDPIKDNYEFYLWELDGTPYDFDLPVTKDLNLVATYIEVEEEIELVTKTATASYSGTGGNFDGNETLNQAATINLDETVFTVLAKKTEYTGNTQIGLNAAGQIRLYSDKTGGNGNELIIKVDDNTVITEVEFVFAEGKKDPQSAAFKYDDEVINLTNEQITNNTFTKDNLDAKEIALKLTHTGADSTQVWLTSIKITYGTKTSGEVGLTDQQIIDKAKQALTTNELLGANLNAQSIENNLDLITTFKGVNVSWTSSNVDVVKNNGLISAVAKDTNVTLTAKLTLNDVTASKEFTFTVLESAEPGEPNEPNEPSEPEEQLPLGLPVIAGTTPIADFLAMGENGKAKIVGVVTSLAPHTSFSVEDDSGALALRIDDADSNTGIDFAVGDVVEADVVFTTHNDLYQGVVEGTHKVHKGDFGRLNTVNLNEVGSSSTELRPYQNRTVSLTAAEVQTVEIDGFGTIEINVSFGNQTYLIRWDNRVAGVDETFMKGLQAGDYIDVVDATLAWHFGPQIAIGRTSEVVENTDGIFGPDATDQDKLTQSLNLLTLESVLGNNSDALKVVRNLSLTKNFDDVTVTWTSNNTTVIDTNGKVTRALEGDTNVTLTATVSIGSLSDSRTFQFTVLEFVESTNPSDNDPNISSYYSNLDGLTGSAFKSALENMIKTKGVAQGSTGQVKAADKYNGQNYNIYTGFGSYGNREHVWPNSKLGNAPKDDLHNLRAAVVSVNSSRSNYPFVQNNKPFTGTESYQRIGSGWYPGDEHIGDVARIVFYVAARYNLSLNDVGNLDMFLQWHELDPVSDFERVRNNNIEDIVGSRNPFIDYPEYVDVIFDNTNLSSEITAETLLNYNNNDVINLLSFKQQYVDLNKRNTFIV